MRIKTWAVAGVLASAIALGACGSSSSSSSSSGGGGSSDVTAFCAKVKQLNALQNPFANVKPGDVQGAKAAIDKLKSEVASVGAVAPAAIKSDIDQVEKTFADFGTAVQGAKTPQEFLQAVQGFQTKATAIQQTVTRLNAYTKKTCGKA
jgi:hypothetical protein